MDTLNDKLMDCVERLHAEDFSLPLTFSLISANGVLVAGRYTGAWGAVEIEILHEPAEPLRLPLYLMFVDARGAAAGFVMPTDTEPAYFVPLPARPEY
jgi:hypothetical protein